MAYTPPVKEYGFLLRHVFDGDKRLAEATGGELTVEDGKVITAPGFAEAFERYADGGWISFRPRERPAATGCRGCWPARSASCGRRRTRRSRCAPY